MADRAKMQCEEMFRMLADYLDHELCAEDCVRIEMHLKACEMCAMEVRFEQKVIEEIRRKVRSTCAPPELIARIERALDGA